MMLLMIYIRNTFSLKTVKLPSTCQPYISKYHETFPIFQYFLEIFCSLRLILLVIWLQTNARPCR